MPAFQGQQGGGPAFGGLPENERPFKTYGDQQILFIPDNSGSMSGPKAAEASAAIATCLAELNAEANKDGFRVSVITYGSHSQVVLSAQSPATASVTLDGSGGGTLLAPALQLAHAEIDQYKGRPNRKLQDPVVIVFSDGQLSDGAQAEAEARALKSRGATVIAIGFGSDADEQQLRRIASQPDNYAFANVGQLKHLFALVGKTLSQQMRP
jgi:uncharacterized protein YegL